MLQALFAVLVRVTPPYMTRLAVPSFAGTEAGLQFSRRAPKVVRSAPVPRPRGRKRCRRSEGQAQRRAHHQPSHVQFLFRITIVSVDGSSPSLSLRGSEKRHFHRSCPTAHPTPCRDIAAVTVPRPSPRRTLKEERTQPRMAAQCETLLRVTVSSPRTHAD